MKKRASSRSEENRWQIGLTLLFSLIIFGVLVVTLIVVAVVLYILIRTGVLTMFGSNLPRPSYLILFMLVISTVIGFIVAFIINKFPLKMFDRMITRINQLASGDYTVRLQFGRLLGRHPSLSRLSASFNTLAEELQNTEMLRSDFINNFSHEFKTPIVSIAGFAKLLRRGNLTEQQKEEYIAIIEEESLRLSYMATNILNLTRVENQSILTEVTEFNLSEQIRACILLMENKWTSKHLELHVDFGEYMISANEELLKQVWINLIDNAVKFSPDYGILQIDIGEKDGLLTVAVSNNADPIPPESRKKIFNKFYQADESHSTEGNGIGLAVVKNVVELHKGTVAVDCGQQQVTFTVRLPKNACAQKG